MRTGKGDGDAARGRGPQQRQSMDVFGGTEGQVGSLVSSWNLSHGMV